VVHITVLCCYSTSSPRAIDSGSYDWKKLDPKAEETKALVAQYWKWEGNDLEGRKFNQGKILK